MTTWNEIRLANEEDRLWELFHENSKWTQFSPKPGLNDDIKSRIEQMHVSLPVQSAFAIPLNEGQESGDDLFHRVFQAHHGDRSRQDPVSFAMLSRIFRACANLRRHASGADTYLSPLELYAFISGVEDLSHGLYHFSPQENILQLVNERISAEQISEAIPGDGGSQVSFFITALLQRTAYLGERGYRIALIESGQMTQNIIHSSAMQSLSAKSVLNFHDRRLEKALGIDGVNHVLLHIVTI